MGSSTEVSQEVEDSRHGFFDPVQTSIEAALAEPARDVSVLREHEARRVVSALVV